MTGADHTGYDDTGYDDTVDVIVVGSGGGITGAYTAAREGLSVALLYH